MGFRPRTSEHVSGDYDVYQERKLAALDAESQAWDKFDDKLAEEEVWIRKGQARRTRNEGRVRRLRNCASSVKLVVTASA